MSVSSLGGILRRLRRDIAERATFRNGTVVEMLDATHVLVDIGKPVPAFCSPIFLPAVVVGSPVTVRIQGSHYDVVDAPLSAARLVTGAEMDSILARLTALEPSWPNLIPNPSPSSLTGWSSTSTFSPDADYLATDYWPDTATDHSSFAVRSKNAGFSIYPVPSGTGGCAVTAGATYTSSARLLNWYGTDATLGVVWSDSGGSTVSTATGSLTASFAADGTWIYLGTPSPSTDEKGCAPIESFVAPSGVAFARPFVAVTQPVPPGAYYRTTLAALWDFRRTA